jgi:hypothetical protein
MCGGNSIGHDCEVAQMNGYLTAEETAKKWGVSIRQVQILCRAGKIEGAMKFCKVWAIPKDAVILVFNWNF